ncbi:MAG: hypothetical protein HGA16_01980 [Candidatus Moranbacteria bacterium]|nr:hypothetical protein [Candidatus Moranbacteria bacterium]
MGERHSEIMAGDADMETVQMAAPRRFLGHMGADERHALLHPLIRNWTDRKCLANTDDSLFTETSKQSLYADRERARLEMMKLLPGLIEEMRNDPVSVKLRECIVAGDAETLYSANPDDLSGVKSEQSIAAEKHRAMFMGMLEDYFSLFSSLIPEDARETIFESYLLESVDASAQEAFFERKRKYLESGGKEPEAGATELPVVGYEYFDPEREVKRIAAFANEVPLGLPQDEYVVEKRRRFKSFMKQFAEQAAGKAKLNAELEDVLLEKGVFDEERSDRLRSLIYQKAEKLRLSPVQLGRYDALLEKLKEWNREMDEAQGDLVPGADDAKLFEKFFEVSPKGEVNVRRGPVSFFVDCRDIRDYARARGRSEESVTSSRGFSNEFKTAVKNVSGEMAEEDIEEVRIHEERHSLRSVIDSMLHESIIYRSLNKKEDGILMAKLIKAMVKEKRTGAEKRAADEVFAYLKDGSSIASLRRTLMKQKSDGGLYDYLQENQDEFYRELGVEDAPEMDALFDRARSEYRSTLSNALDVVESLLLLKIPRKEIIATLEFEPLSQWKRATARLESGGVFKKSRKLASKGIGERMGAAGWRRAMLRMMFGTSQEELDEKYDSEIAELQKESKRISKKFER